jgi:hypothetical protein
VVVFVEFVLGFSWVCDGHGGLLVAGGGSLLGVVACWTIIEFFFPHFNSNVRYKWYWLWKIVMA